MSERAATSSVDRRTLRLCVWIALLAATIICFAGIFQHHLWTPDEPREAEIGREMALSGPSAVPRLNGEPFLEKPPLWVWSMALGYRAFGVSDGVARLPAAIFGIGTLLVAFALGRRVGGRSAGLFAALALATTAKFAEVSHSSVNDNALVFFVAAGHLAISIGRDRWREGRETNAWIAAGLCAGLAFLTKSFIGPVLIVGPTLGAALAMREWSFARAAFARLALWCGVFVVALGVPWVLALAREAGWDAVKVCLVGNTIGRFLGDAAGPQSFSTHAQGPLEYVKTFPLESLPWILVLPAAIASGLLKRERRGGRALFLALTTLAGLALLSIPAGKRGLYALPLYPAASVVPGLWLSRLDLAPFGRMARATYRSLLALAIGLAMGLALAAATIRIFPFTADHQELATLRAKTPIELSIAAASFAVASLLSIAIARSSKPNLPRRATALAAAMFALFTLGHATLRPLIDPFKEMRDGVTLLEHAVPDPDRMLAYEWDETTSAVVPFYSGRLLPAVQRNGDSLARLQRGAATSLIAMDDPEHAPDPELAVHLRKSARVKLSSTRNLVVYVLEKPR